MKSKDCKLVNRVVRTINKILSDDVFGSRFCLVQVRKARQNGIDYFIYRLVDNEVPSRSRIIPKWITVWSCRRILLYEMNNFILSSGFWQEYNTRTNENKK